MDEEEISRLEDVIEEVDSKYLVFSSDDELDFQFELNDHDYLSILKELDAKDSDFEDGLEGPIECPFKDQGCKKSFVRRFNLLKHLKSHEQGYDKSGTICHICGKIITGNFSNHLRGHDDSRRFKCDICGQCFRQKVVLKTHLLIHKNEKPFECPYCLKRFRQKYSVQSHLKNKHIGIKEHICEICGKEFGDKNSLQKHMLVHDSNQPHQCKTCLITFRHRSSLSRHQKVHLKVKQCEYCNQNFRYESFLKKHVLTVHKGYVLDVLEESMKPKVKLEVKQEIVSDVIETAQIIEVDTSALPFFTQTVTISSIVDVNK